MTEVDYGKFLITKEIISSTLTTSDVNIAELIGNGAVVEEVLVRTDSTGLAWGTNFQLKADWIVFFSTAVSGLGASSIKDLGSASVTGVKAIVEEGTKYISVSNTVAVGTGAWVVTLVFVCRKLDQVSSGFAI